MQKSIRKAACIIQCFGSLQAAIPLTTKGMLLCARIICERK